MDDKRDDKIANDDAIAALAARLGEALKAQGLLLARVVKSIALDCNTGSMEAQHRKVVA